MLTLYTGLRLTNRLEFLFDLESAGGAGLSNALGVAGFPNLDVVRNPTLGSAPYVARAMLHYTVPLSSETTEATQNPLSLATTVPRRRLEFRFGKMSTVDFFDLNSVGSDSHLQFMNWTVVNNGAYDYAADTRGYTYGFLTEFYDPGWALRFGEMLMPKVANGIELDWNVTRARAENIEFEFYPSLRKKHAGVVRLLSFINHANMGSYREAINGFLDGQDPAPDITAHRRQGRVKYGFGLNTEQELTRDLRAISKADGMMERTSRSPTQRSIEPRCSAAIIADVYGSVPRTRWAPPSSSTASQATTAVIWRSSGLGLPAGRRRTELRNRTHLRRLLYAPYLARRFVRSRCAANLESGL